MGKGSLSHNNREFYANNVDKSRTKDNICFRQESLQVAYDKCYGSAVEEYNAKQKREDRKIKNGYFMHLFNREPSKSVITGANKQKSFYEDLIQIGTKDDTACGTEQAKFAVECLTEYMNGFDERNPNFYVINAVIHLDEATPHLHLDYIPLGHYESGLSVRNAMAKALEEMGFGKGKNAIDRWRKREWEVLEKICNEHGIEVSEPKKSRGYDFSVEEYKEHKDKINELKEQENREIENLNELLKYTPDYDKATEDEFEIQDLFKELDGYLKNPLTQALKKDKINAIEKELNKKFSKISELRDKSEAQSYVLEKLNQKIDKENEDLREKNKNLKRENSQLQKLKPVIKNYERIENVLESISPELLAKAREISEAQKLEERQKEKSVSQSRTKKHYGQEL